MWKVSVLSLTLVVVVVAVYGEQETTNGNQKVESEETGASAVIAVPPQDDTDHRSPDQDRLAGFHLSSGHDDKRGKHFGFVGSRGWRGKTLQETLFGEEFPVRQSEAGSARLRMLLGKHQQELLAKNKRKPHFGFHGSRG